MKLLNVDWVIGMNVGKEIGGYIEFEQYNYPMLHAEAIKLNSARNCLLYLIHARNIKKIMLPYYLCDSISRLCEENGVSIRYYCIGDDFKPFSIQPKDDEWIYFVNYYGLLSNEFIMEFCNIYKKVIVDNVQAYFRKNIKGVDTLYSCRKYFGVSDGGILYTDASYNKNLRRDHSFERIHHLLGRYEISALTFYDEYQREEQKFYNSDLQFMSKLTENLLHSFAYDTVREKRNSNFITLHNELGEMNRLNFELEIDGPFMYPLYVEQGQKLRQYLIKNKIYISMLWPEVKKVCAEDSIEYSYAENILPLPIDQRYSTKDMNTIIDVIKSINM